MTAPSELKISAETASATTFQPHGEYLGTIEDRVVTAHVRGPFNREMILELARRVADFYSTLPPVKTAGITVFHESMMFTAEAVETYRDVVAYELSLLPHGIVVAHVADLAVEGSALMPGILENKVYRHYGIPYKFFTSLPEAQAWVYEQLSN